MQAIFIMRHKTIRPVLALTITCLCLANCGPSGGTVQQAVAQPTPISPVPAAPGDVSPRVIAPTLSQLISPGGNTKTAPVPVVYFERSAGVVRDFTKPNDLGKYVSHQVKARRLVDAKTGEMYDPVTDSYWPRMKPRRTEDGVLFAAHKRRAQFRPHPDFRQNYTYTGQVETLVAFGRPQFGVGGIQAPASTLPIQGTAVYAGEASLRRYENNSIPNGANQATDHLVGRARLTADFAKARVGLDVTGLARKSSGAQGDTPFDRASFPNLVLKDGIYQGSLKSGMQMRLTKNGTAVTPAGQVTKAKVSGAFFGPNPSAQPFEAGGVLTIEGSTGVITGDFIAKK